MHLDNIFIYKMHESIYKIQEYTYYTYEILFLSHIYELMSITAYILHFTLHILCLICKIAGAGLCLKFRLWINHSFLCRNGGWQTGNSLQDISQVPEGAEGDKGLGATLVWHRTA